MVLRKLVNMLKYPCLIVTICLVGYLTYQRFVAPRHSAIIQVISGSSAPAPAAPVGTLSQQYTAEETIFFNTGKGNAFKHERRLRDYVRTRIVSPSGTRPNIKEDPTGRKKDVSQIGQSRAVDKLLDGRRNGFFVECGAHDGEDMSNTLFFELERNWTGLLIEGDPMVHEALIKKNRNAYVLSACLSATTNPGVVNFKSAGGLGGIVSQLGDWKNRGNGPELMVPCYPFNTILDAIGVNQIDYFSLDVERAELAILKTINFEHIRIDVISLEYTRLSAERSLKELADLVNFFNQTAVKYGRRYEVAFFLPEGSTGSDGQDVVFKLQN